MPPRTRYATSGNVKIAYQVIGDGPVDLVMLPGFVSNVDFYWEMPAVPRFFDRLTAFSRLITYDKRGTGLSDPVAEVPSLEERTSDLDAVLEAAGAGEAILFGLSEGGPTAIRYAATNPGKVRALALYGTAAKFTAGVDCEWGMLTQAILFMLQAIDEAWGEGALMNFFLPTHVDDEDARHLWGRFQRMGASPAKARALLAALAEIDVRHLLPAIRVPTLVLHRTDDLAVPVEGARYMAGKIPGAKLVELPGADHIPFFGEHDDIADAVEAFVTGRPRSESDRVLATILVVEAPGAAAHGSGAAEGFRKTAREQAPRFGGRELDSAGDGFLAAFDRPARAIECARAIRAAAGKLGLRVRAGLHAGECEVIGKKLGGMAVHVAARVMSRAAPGEILVSETVKSLLLGSKLAFDDRGLHALEGIPAEWRLYAAGG